MTEEQKLQIRLLRGQGIGYKQIGDVIGVTRDCVRSYCRNHGLAGHTPAVKMNIKERSLKACDTAITLADEMRLDESITMGTTLINAATAYKAFGDAERALPLYEKAKEIYEARLESNDRRLGGLYNNMALALKDTEQFERAKDMFLMALSVIEKIGGGELEMAITYCNMADLCACEGKGGAAECLEKAFGLISTPTLSRDGYYAFVCEKCAPTFGYYGLGEYEKELSMRARDIYEGS